ncbi:MAG: hypothetical protein AAF518_10320 [Spirochaetota bacterium]
METKRMIRTTQVLLTLGAFEFFGPIVRDTNASHLLNPAWVGHARFHLMWCLLLWLSLGSYCLYLIWNRSGDTLKNLYRALALQGFNALAFWGAVILGPAYSAEVFDANIHVGFLNINENILVFIVLSLLLVTNFLLLRASEKNTITNTSKQVTTIQEVRS